MVYAKLQIFSKLGISKNSVVPTTTLRNASLLRIVLPRPPSWAALHSALVRGAPSVYQNSTLIRQTYCQPPAVLPWQRILHPKAILLKVFPGSVLCVPPRPYSILPLEAPSVSQFNTLTRQTYCQPSAVLNWQRILLLKTLLLKVPPGPIPSVQLL